MAHQCIATRWALAGRAAGTATTATSASTAAMSAGTLAK
jgi:hypothetical protein